MEVRKKISARSLNTFSIDAEFDTLIEVQSKADFNQLSEYTSHGFRVLGGGSNILITQDVSVPVIHVSNKGIEVVKEAEEYVLLSIAAGENWHDVVLWCLEHNFGGIENLALIPGNAGTAPIQNIGAYGVELQDVFFALKAYNITHGHEHTFHKQECEFGYRDSVFKNRLQGQFIITEIILQLTKEGFHKINTSYGQIRGMLEHKGIEEPGIREIADVVIEIRTDKLPDPDIIGNAGSFFKNPVVNMDVLELISAGFENVPRYPLSDDKVKIPAAWLIDQCGWKGKRIGDTGTYENQALVLVNHGNATGQEIYDLSEQIRESVVRKFGIELEREVNVW